MAGPHGPVNLDEKITPCPQKPQDMRDALFLSKNAPTSVLIYVNCLSLEETTLHPCGIWVVSRRALAMEGMHRRPKPHL